MARPGPARLAAWHARVAWRASRIPCALAAGGGFLLRLLLPVEGAWLAGAAAAGAAAVAILLLAPGAGPQGRPWPRAPGADPAAAMEAAGAREQFANAFARSALVLGGFAAGLGLAGLAGLGRA